MAPRPSILSGRRIWGWQIREQRGSFGTRRSQGGGIFGGVVGWRRRLGFRRSGRAATRSSGGRLSFMALPNL
ncbi:hypothetical protein EJB05_25895 [Eragrostis curvula]|uniref:Uncharacterized protein n=1 Tax=Eragrostis curvula TaxID=38414 RepID=A0A5J9UJM7_9POAL|nr:hypothetical protein EJB05_25895 [Eragrostis curvula]